MTFHSTESKEKQRAATSADCPSCAERTVHSCLPRFQGCTQKHFLQEGSETSCRFYHGHVCDVHRSNGPPYRRRWRTP